MARSQTGIGKPIGLRLYPEARLNAWIDAHPEPKPSGPEAIRRLMERGLYAAERRKLRAPKPRKAAKLSPALRLRPRGSFSVGRATGSAREQVSALACSGRLRTDFARRQITASWNSA